MALKIWLPLNSANIENKGEKGVISNIDATLDDYGPSVAPLGESVWVDVTGHILANISNLSLSADDDLSISYWYTDVPPSYSSNITQFLLRGDSNGSIIGLYSEGSQYISFDYFGDSVNLWGTIPLYYGMRSWTHIAITHKKNEDVINVYVNGVNCLTSPVSISNIKHNYSRLTLGCMSTDGQEFYDQGCNIQDFRLYDTCLSQKEIIELHNQLVTHFSLDNICSGKNLFNNTYTRANPFIWKSDATDAQTTSCDVIAENLVPGEVYTFSCYTPNPIAKSHNSTVNSANPDVPVTLWLYFYTSTTISSTTSLRSYDAVIQFNSQPTSLSVTFKCVGENRYAWRFMVPEGMHSCAVNVNHYSNGNIVKVSKYADFQLEEGGTYHYLGNDAYPKNLVYNSNINNVESYNVSSFNNSPRYQQSTYFSEKNQSYIKFENPFGDNQNPSQVTMSFWFWFNTADPGATFPTRYRTVFSSANNDLTSNLWVCINCENAAIWVYCNGNYVIRENITNNSSIISAMQDCKWHHVTMTYSRIIPNINQQAPLIDNRWVIYFDGEEIATKLTNIQLVMPQICAIGDSYTGISWNTKCGLYMSDFRIYGTALSDIDVKNLYRDSAAIDNLQKLHCTEIVEDNDLSDDPTNLIYNSKFLINDTASTIDRWHSNSDGLNLTIDKSDDCPGHANVFTFASGNYSPANHARNLNNIKIYDELIPIIEGDTYSYSIWLKNVDSTGLQYPILLSYDNRGTYVACNDVYKPQGSETDGCLTQDLNDGDVYVYLDKSILRWNTNDLNNNFNYIGICESPAWQYQRNIYHQYIEANGIDLENRRLILRTPWSGGTWKAGTKVARFRDGCNMIYPVVTNMPATWAKYNSPTFQITGTDGSSDQFNRNTTYFVTPSFMYGGYKFADIQFRNESQLQLRQPTSRVSNNSKVEHTGVVIGKEFNELLGVKARYIRDYTTGNTVNQYRHWCEIQAFDTLNRNVAFACPILEESVEWYRLDDADVIVGNENNPNFVKGHIITSGEHNINTAYVSGDTYITIDMGLIHDITKVKVWHFYSDGRTYHGTKTQVSVDGVNWVTIFDSAIEGEYAESSEGHTIDIPSAMKIYNTGVITSNEIEEV